MIITKFELPEGSFDAVLVHFVLPQVKNEERECTVKELYRVLGESSRLYCLNDYCLSAKRELRGK